MAHLRLFIVSVFCFLMVGCSQDGETIYVPATPPPTTQEFDTDMTIIYDGAQLGVYDVHATYDTDNLLYNCTAMLSNGQQLSFTFGYLGFSGTAYTMLSSLKIADPDGSNAVTSQYHPTGRYFRMDMHSYNMSAQTCDVEFSGELFADAFNVASESHYITGFTKFHYDIITPGINQITVQNSSEPFKVLKWRQTSSDGAPIELLVDVYGSRQYRFSFEAAPAVGYYEFNNNSTGNKIIVAKYDHTTQQYVALSSGGLLHITEVTADRIKGDFSLTSNIGINASSFNLHYD